MLKKMRRETPPTNKFKTFICLFFSQVRLVILSAIIVAMHLVPKITITTATQATVHCIIKVAGGTVVAITQTSMVCTSMVRSIAKEWRGITGKTSMNLSRGPK